MLEGGIVRVRMRMHKIYVRAAKSGTFHGCPYAKEFGFMALLMLRSSGFHGSPYAKELSIFDGA